MTANSVGSRDSPSRTRSNHDATVSHSECGTNPPAKCCADVRSFVQELPLNAMLCAVLAGPVCSFRTGFSTCLLRLTGGGLPHSVTVRPRWSVCLDGVVTGAFAISALRVPFLRLHSSLFLGLVKRAVSSEPHTVHLADAINGTNRCVVVKQNDALYREYSGIQYQANILEQCEGTEAPDTCAPCIFLEVK